MRKPRTPKKKYLIHVTCPGDKQPIRMTDANKKIAFNMLRELLRNAPIGSVGAVYLRTNPDAPLEDNGIERIGQHRYKGKDGVTKLPHKK